MHSLILKQYKSGKSLLLPKYVALKEKLTNPNVNDHYDPVGKNYYHDFNPNFTFNVKDFRYFKFTPTITLRDGVLTFARFVLRNKKKIPKLKVHFLIHPDLAIFVPKNFSHQFSTWSLSQANKVQNAEAKKIILFGMAHESYLKDIYHVATQLQQLEKCSPNAEIEVCLPMRKDVFSAKEVDSIFLHEVFNLIKDTFSHKSLKIVRPSDLMERTSFKDQIFFDLAPDNYFVSDNFMHYLSASRGGTVNKMAQSAPTGTFFTIPLSLHHKFHIAPLPKIESRFDLLEEYNTISKHINPLCDPVFQNIARGVL